MRILKLKPVPKFQQGGLTVPEIYASNPARISQAYRPTPAPQFNAPLQGIDEGTQQLNQGISQGRALQQQAMQQEKFEMDKAVQEMQTLDFINDDILGIEYHYSKQGEYESIMQELGEIPSTENGDMTAVYDFARRAMSHKGMRGLQMHNLQMKQQQKELDAMPKEYRQYSNWDDLYNLTQEGKTGKLVVRHGEIELARQQALQAAEEERQLDAEVKRARIAASQASVAKSNNDIERSQNPQLSDYGNKVQSAMVRAGVNTLEEWEALSPQEQQQHFDEANTQRIESNSKSTKTSTHDQNYSGSHTRDSKYKADGTYNTTVIRKQSGTDKGQMTGVRIGSSTVTKEDIKNVPELEGAQLIDRNDSGILRIPINTGTIFETDNSALRDYLKSVGIIEANYDDDLDEHPAYKNGALEFGPNTKGTGTGGEGATSGTVITVGGGESKPTTGKEW